MYEQKLNRESNHYRRCPNCDIELMANHGNRKFCSDKCGDDYNNRKKEINMLTIPPVAPEIATMTPPTDKNAFYLKQCIAILWECKIPSEGKRVSLQTLREKGFNYLTYSSRISITGAYLVEYGPFVITLEDDKTVFVKLKNN